MIRMFAGIIIASFTAAIATVLTVGELVGKVRGKDGLPRARIATVSDTTSVQYLTGDVSISARSPAYRMPWMPGRGCIAVLEAKGVCRPRFS